MASNFRHLTGCEDGTGTVLLLRKVAAPAPDRDRALAAERPNRWQAHASRSTCTGRLPDRRSSVKKLLSFACLFVDVSFSSRINHRPRAACRVFKADVLRESKKIDMVLGQ